MCDQIIALNYSRWPTSEIWKKAMEGCLYFTLGDQFTYSMVLSGKSKFWKILRGLFVHMAWKKSAYLNILYLMQVSVKVNHSIFSICIMGRPSWVPILMLLPPRRKPVPPFSTFLNVICFIHSRINSLFCHLTVEQPWVNPWTILSPSILINKVKMLTAPNIVRVNRDNVHEALST